MNLSCTPITVSGTNPFDRSNNELQHEYDTAILRLLSEIGNFAIQTIRNPIITNLHDYEIEPNSWIVEQLVSGTSELSSSSMVLTPNSSDLVNYSFGIGYFSFSNFPDERMELCCDSNWGCELGSENVLWVPSTNRQSHSWVNQPQLFYKARSIREEHNIYYIPFSPEVWICLFSLLLIITVTLTFILGRETKLPHDTPYDLIARIADERHDEGVEWDDISETQSRESLLQRERWEMGEILLVTIGALGQQGSARDPSTSAARMLLLVMLLLAALAYTAYSASVISFVSLLPSTEKEQSAITRSVPRNRKVVMHDTNFFKHTFKPSFEEVTYSEIHDGLDDAINGKSLFISDKDASLTYILRKGYAAELRCSLARVFLGTEYQRVFALRKSSGLKESINRDLIRLQQHGFLSREKKRFFDTGSTCSYKERSSVSGFVSFNLNDIKPALCILCGGILASVLLIFVEFFTYSSSKMLRKIFFSQWTKNDKHINRLAAELLKSKNDGIISRTDAKKTVGVNKAQFESRDNPTSFFHLPFLN